MAHKHKLNCKQCGVEFECSNKSKYCSKKCWPSRVIARAEYKPVPKLSGDCGVCGKSFETHVPGRKYCSRACNMKAWKVRNTEGYLLESARIVARELRLIGKRRDISLRKQGIIRGKADLRRKRLAHSCADCGEPMVGETLRRRRCLSCSDDRIQAYRRAAKSLRRARIRRSKVEGVVVDPMAIFERDGWLCHLCGGKTLKARRGTTHDKAPELDHIIPLAKGGSHTEGNLACSHRLCNQKKSDRIVGQPSLLVLCN